MRGGRRPVERLLAELGDELRPLGWRARRRALAEARDHLLSAVEDEIARGATPAEAEARVSERFGEPALIAGSLALARPRQRGRAGRVGSVFAFAAGGAALLRLGWEPGSANPAAPVHRDFLVVVVLMLALLAWVAGRRRVFGRVAQDRGALLLRAGAFAALLALPLVMLDLSRYAGARFAPGDLASASERAQWHAARVSDAIAGSVVMSIVIAAYAVGALWITSGRSGATSRTLAAGAGCGVAMGLVVYALSPFGGALRAGPWLSPVIYAALPLAFFGVPALAGKLAGDGISGLTDSIELSLARVAQGLRAGACAAAVGALVIALLTIPTMVHFPDRVALKEPHPVAGALTYDRQMSVGDGAGKYVLLLFLAPLLGAAMGAAASDAWRRPLLRPGEVLVQGSELPGG